MRFETRKKYAEEAVKQTTGGGGGGGGGKSTPRFSLEKSPVNFTGGWVNPPGSVWTGV